MIACEEGDNEMVEMLLDYDPDITIKANDGLTAQDIAIMAEIDLKKDKKGAKQ